MAYGTIFIPRYQDTTNHYFEYNSYTSADATNTNWIITRGTGVYSTSSAITEINLIRDNGSFNGGTIYVYGES